VDQISFENKRSAEINRQMKNAEITLRSTRDMLTSQTLECLGCMTGSEVASLFLYVMTMPGITLGNH